MSFPTHAGDFALGTFAQVGGRPFPGLVVQGRVRDVSGLGRTMRDLLADWDSTLVALSRLAADPRGNWLGGDTVVVLPPLEPGQILQAGANYQQDVDEAPTEPFLLLGSSRAMCGAYDDVVLPREGEQHDWELELAVVIGQPGRHIARADAMAHVAAYTICNDITTRDRLDRPGATGPDWFVAKNAMTFLPTGPFLVPAEFVGDPMQLRIRCEHNGIVRQDESTKDMIFDVAQLIEYASANTELRPGDLLLTGSPAGSGASYDVYLKPGDVLDATITGLGAQRNTCVSEI